MKIIKLKLKNIKRHKCLEIDFSDLTIILGENGSGKSTIMEAIYYAFFRKTLVPNSSYLISDDIKYEKDGKIKYKGESSIALLFELDDKAIYEIYHNLVSSKCYLKKDGKIIASTIRDFNYQIKQLLNINDNIFLNVIYTAQMDLLNMFDSTESVRHELYNKMFNLEKYKKIRVAIQEYYNKTIDFKQLENNKNILNLKVDNNDKLIIEKNNIKNEILDKKKQLENEIIELENNIQQLTKKIDTKTNEYNSLNSRYTDLLTFYNSITNKINELNSSNLKNEIEHISITLSELKNMKLLKDKQYENFDDEILKFIKFKNEKLNEYQNYVNQKNNLENEIHELQLEKMELEATINDYIQRKKEYDSLNENLMLLKEKADKILKHQKDVKDKKLSIKFNETKFSESLYILRQYINFITGQQETLLKDSIYDLNQYIDLSIRGEIPETCPTCFQSITNEHITKIENMLTEKVNTFIDEYNKYKEISKLDSKLLTYENELNNINHEMNKLENQMNYLIITKLDTNEANKKLQEIDEKINELKNEINKIQELIIKNSNINIINNIIDSLLENGFNLDDKDLTDINYEEFDINNFYQKLISYKDYLRIKNNITDNEKKLDKLTKELSYKEEIINLEISTLLNEKINNPEITDINQVYIYLNNMYTEIIHLDSEIKNIVYQKETLTKTKNEKITDLEIINSKVSELDTSIISLTKENEKLKKDLINIEKILSYQNVLDELKLVFKNDQLPLFLKVKYIEEVNRLLPETVSMFNFDFIPEIDFKTLNIKDYHKYSGGQKIIIALAIRFILTKLFISDRNKMIILDEPTSYLDEDRVIHLKDFIENTMQEMQTILVTHNQELKNIASANIINL